LTAPLATRLPAPGAPAAAHRAGFLPALRQPRPAWFHRTRGETLTATETSFRNPMSRFPFYLAVKGVRGGGMWHRPTGVRGGWVVELHTRMTGTVGVRPGRW